MCDVFMPTDISELQDFIGELRSDTTFSIKGGGNSFGDVFLPDDHTVIDMSGLNRNITSDFSTTSVTVDAGVNVGELQRFLLCRGYFLPSCSGAINNTVAGDVSANINGKDSWKYGHYYNNVLSIELLDVAGNIRTITKSDEAFNAIIGGLGLIGVIVNLTLCVEPVQGSMLSFSRKVTNSLAESVHLLIEQCVELNDFAYAWVDPLKKGAKRGRGVVEVARFIPGVDDDLNELLKMPDRVLGIPDDWFWTAYRLSWNVVQKLNLHTPIFSAVNAARYQMLKRNSAMSQTGYFKYQFPMMSTLPNWNKRFVKQGMQEIQCIFDAERFERAVFELWNTMAKHGLHPELAAIRKHTADDAYLSFASDGLSTTLSYDRYGRSKEELYSIERKLVETVIKYAGKIYLAKFPYINNDELKAMYPNVNQFLEQKKKFDPHNQLMSSASSRLFHFN